MSRFSFPRWVGHTAQWGIVVMYGSWWAVQYGFHAMIARIRSTSHQDTSIDGGQCEMGSCTSSQERRKTPKLPIPAHEERSNGLLECDCHKLKTDNENLKSDNERLRSDKERLNNDKERLNNENERLQAAYSRSEKENEHLRRSSDALTAQMADRMEKGARGGLETNSDQFARTRLAERLKMIYQKPWRDLMNQIDDEPQGIELLKNLLKDCYTFCQGRASKNLQECLFCEGDLSNIPGDELEEALDRRFKVGTSDRVRCETKEKWRTEANALQDVQKLRQMLWQKSHPATNLETQRESDSQSYRERQNQQASDEDCLGDGLSPPEEGQALQEERQADDEDQTELDSDEKGGKLEEEESQGQSEGEPSPTADNGDQLPVEDGDETGPESQADLAEGRDDQPAVDDGQGMLEVPSKQTMAFGDEQKPLDNYLDDCVDSCWPISILNPPLILHFPERGSRDKTEYFINYSLQEDVEYEDLEKGSVAGVVWPAVLTEKMQMCYQKGEWLIVD